MERNEIGNLQIVFSPLVFFLIVASLLCLCLCLFACFPSFHQKMYFYALQDHAEWDEGIQARRSHRPLQND